MNRTKLPIHERIGNVPQFPVGVDAVVAEKDVVVEDKEDKITLASIYHGIPEDILLSIADKETAKEAWVAIKTMCQGAERVKMAKVQTLKSEFESLSMKDGEQLDDFYLRLNGLVTNIRALGEEVKDNYVVKKLLRVVPQRFLQIVSTIEQFSDLETLTVEETIGSLKAHEERTKRQTEDGNGQFLLTEEEWSKRESAEGKLLLTREEWIKRNNNKGGGEGSSNQRYRGNARNRGGYDKSKVRCYNCSGYGHYAVDCRKPRKDKDQKQEVNMSQIEDNEPALLIVEQEDTENDVMLVSEEKVMPKLGQDLERTESNLWYLDNGASNHMSGQCSKFCNLDENVTGKVRFGDGSTVDIKRKGSIIFVCKNGEKRLLNELYYIPMLRNTIISLGQLSVVVYKVVLNDNFLWVRNTKGELLMKVKRSPNRLYKIIIESGKAQNNYRAKLALELVHADLCGPISPTTAGGNRYFLLLVDDYSRWMWVYMLKSKDQALLMFKRFKAHVEKGTDKHVKMIRTDRGGEFCSQEFKNFCEDHGIARQYTALYTPQQNGVVERRNRTVVEMGRSLLKQMELPLVL
ncbi:hypothetical protein AgCh_009329 [Apium graveolens]